MSRPLPVGHAAPVLPPAQQIQQFVELYHPQVKSSSYTRLVARARELQLNFSKDELLVLAALDTPARVQEFLNTQIYYNYDHTSPDQEETCYPPRQVLAHAHAHCFEGALYAYAVNYLHGHAPGLVLLEASQDPDHNLVVMQDPHTGRYGANAHSGWAHLDGRPAEFDSLAALVETYVPYYISDLTNDPQDLTLVGYSEPFDLVAKFSTGWIGATEPLWDLYYLYIDDRVRFHYLHDPSDKTHLYPLVRALKEKWIELDADGKPRVNIQNLSPAAQKAWYAFWQAFDPPTRPPRGAAREIQEEFRRLTGTTPIDLQDNAEDFVYFLESGYRIEQLVTQPG